MNERVPWVTFCVKVEGEVKKGMRDELLEVCMKFIQDNQINCRENIYQSDRVVLNAQEFIERICDVVGYYDVEEDEP